MDNAGTSRKRSVKELSKFYVEYPQSQDIDKNDDNFIRSKSQQNINASPSPTIRHFDDFDLNKEATLKKSSWVVKNIKVDSDAELVTLSRSNAVRHFVSNSTNNLNKMEPARSMDELKVSLQKSLANDLSKFYLNKNVFDDDSFDDDSEDENLREIDYYEEVDDASRSSKNDADFIADDISYDTITGLRGIREIDGSPGSSEYVRGTPNRSQYDSILLRSNSREGQELLSRQSHPVHDGISSNQDCVRFVTVASVYENACPIRKTSRDAGTQPSIEQKVNNVQEIARSNAEFDHLNNLARKQKPPPIKSHNVPSFGNNAKAIGNKLGLDIISGLRKTNETLQTEPSTEGKKHNLQKTTSDPTSSSSGYNRVSAVDNRKEKQRSASFKSYLENAVGDVKFATREIVYETVSCLKSAPRDFEYDHILANDIPIPGQKPSPFRPYTKELSRTQDMVIKELIETEATYLRKLSHLIENYLSYFRKIDISPNIELVFGNIEKLYEETQKIYGEMKRCTSADEIAQVFISHSDIFDHYTEFIRNRSVSSQWVTAAFGEIIKDRQIELEDQQSCESYLANPIQRPGRYKLLLEKLQHELTRNDDSHQLLQKAIVLIDNKILEMNTMLAIDCIQWCTVNLFRMGSFLMKDIFNMKSEDKTVVFLFEKCIVCCKEDKFRYDRYNFVNCIELDNLSIRHCEWSPSFEISCFDRLKSYPNNNQFQFYLEADVMSVKERWVEAIHKILWGQLEYCKEQHTLNVNQQKLTDIQREYDTLDVTAFHKEMEIFGHGEYYSLRKALYEEVRHTPGMFFDKNFHPRIEIISSDVQKPEYIYLVTIPPAQRELLQDLIADEEAYLKDLKECIDGFYSSVEDVSSYKFLLFNNIEEMYKETEKLYLKLLKCNTIDAIGNAFLESTRMFDSYTNYIRNKSSYDYITMEFKNSTEGGKKEISPKNEKKWDDYLIHLLLKPPKYKTFLEKLQTQLTKAGQHVKSLKAAIKFINDKITRAITLMNIDSIHRCPFDLTAMGVFLKKGTLQIKNKCECVLFLFEEILVLCLKDSYHPDTYLYFDSIEANQLSIRDIRHPVEFQLKSIHTSKGGKHVNCTFDMIAPSTSMKQKWIAEFEKMMGL